LISHMRSNWTTQGNELNKRTYNWLTAQLSKFIVGLHMEPTSTVITMSKSQSQTVSNVSSTNMFYPNGVWANQFPGIVGIVNIATDPRYLDIQGICPELSCRDSL